jgi:mannose-1-phosphate guanylyltransferase
MLPESCVAVILAGGIGERFWPLSTPARPKQLLKLNDPDKSLLQEAVERIETLVGSDNVFLATGEVVARAVSASELVPSSHILVEPEARNTLGALAWAASQLRTRGYSDSTVMAVLTADHAISPTERFRDTVTRALALAESTDGLVTIGIPPTRSETGYGYIQRGEAVEGGFKVRRFAEKPSLEVAQSFVESGEYVWNSGMFFWRLGAFLRELREHQPEVAALVDVLDQDPDSFLKIPSHPIDRALMERSKHIFVVDADFEWDDVGSWDALARTFPADETGNVKVGPVSPLHSSSCIAYSEGIPIGLIGVEDLIVVATPEGVLVCHRDQAQRVREMLATMKETTPRSL